jgi:hypothetical protein
MSENEGTEGTTETTGESTTESGQNESANLGDAGKRALDAMKAERNAAKAEAAQVRKDLAAQAAKLQDFQDRDLTELQKAQKAAADADARIKDVTAKSAARVARATFNALAAARNPDAKTADVLEYVDLTRFVDDDGEVDEKAMQAAVNRLIAEPGGSPAFEGGARRSANSNQDMNQIIRSAAGRA